MIGIIGAGLSGMSAAFHLKKKYILLEKEKTAGGLCRSVIVDGHTIDIGGGHILFTNDGYAKNLFGELLGKNIASHERESYIFMKNTYVKYPFEVNLYGLPKNIIDECINGVMKKKQGNARNFDEWILQAFGSGIAKHYMRPYNRKLWKYDLKKMSTEWLGGRVPSPNVDDMRRGAEKPIEKKFGGNAYFSYPVRGGIQALSDAMSRNLEVSFGSTAKRITRNSVLYEVGGRKKSFAAEKILSSMPLPELIKIIDDVPSDVDKAARKLVYNSILCLAVSIDRKKISDKHWIYYPEKGIIFNRIILSSNLSPSMSPPGKSSITVENTFGKDEKPDIERRKSEIIDNLRKADMIKNSDKIEVLGAYTHKYAYIVYDLGHRKNVDLIHGFLRERGIISIGRFGKWEYFNMDRAIIDGKNAAEQS